MNERVYAYYRVSSQGQTEGDGIPRQQAAVEKFIAAHGLTFMGAFEESMSGTVDGMNRPEFAEMLSYIDSRKDSPQSIQAVVVERLDRLARDLMVSETIIRDLRDRGVKLYAADQSVLVDLATDTIDPTRTLVRQMLGAVSQWEKTMLVKKLRAARDRKAQETGRPCGGNSRFGEHKDRAGQEKLIVDTIQSLCSNDTVLSWHCIADMLNGAGFRTRRGTEWNGGTVFKIARRLGIDKPKLPPHDVRQYRALRWKTKQTTES